VTKRPGKKSRGVVAEKWGQKDGEGRDLTEKFVHRKMGREVSEGSASLSSHNAKFACHNAWLKTVVS
jgi:hypothetical protein